ncbi:class I SAM-dependent methyltransferase [Roseivirga sp. E12]|uniref:class I SAM-dependent methyltransferase n=1 Tax=Roseivirga sp. E12 TaxID=2819237 RepID=UPI001ABC02F9|nr:class I SAM-dependent methyltransferase [Roseivirga sp. E12]MBO3697278.1 methyltransferase domain-containing protein [Roseivirga sp. E12]
MFKFKISSDIRFRNFGFIPSGYFLRDLYGWLFGHRNLIKRLQARDIINAIDPRQNEKILDIGCGQGHFTVEIAKKSQTTIGVDIAEGIDLIKIPETISDQMKFVQVKGVSLPFKDDTFDKVLASAVLGTIENTEEFLSEWRRVLKPEGKLVIVNTSGRPPIAMAYKNQPWFFKFLRKVYIKKFPHNYADFERVLNNNFGNTKSKFPQPNELKYILAQNGFGETKVEQSLSSATGNFIAWHQFIGFLRKGFIPSVPGWPHYYYFFRVVEFFSKTPCDFCHIYISKHVQ